MADEKPKKLTLKDPVDQETLGQLGELERVRQRFAVELLDIEQDKVRLLAAVHKVQEQQSRYYEKILLQRGLPSDSQIEIDANTGEITLKGRPGGPERDESPPEESDSQGNSTPSTGDSEAAQQPS